MLLLMAVPSTVQSTEIDLHDYSMLICMEVEPAGPSEEKIITYMRHSYTVLHQHRACEQIRET